VVACQEGRRRRRHGAAEAAQGAHQLVASLQ
jgi:hypothetical protein